MNNLINGCMFIVVLYLILGSIGFIVKLFTETCEKTDCNLFINSTLCSITIENKTCKCNDDDISYIDEEGIRYGELGYQCYVPSKCDIACPRLTSNTCYLDTPLMWIILSNHMIMSLIVSSWGLMLLSRSEKN